MIALLEKKAPPQIQPGFTLGFHLRMALASLVVLIICVIGCKVTSAHIAIGGQVVAIFIISAMLAPLPIYCHEKGRIAEREAILIIAWELLIAIATPVLVIIGARSRMPFQDPLLGRLDQALGFNVPAIAAWADHHWMGIVINKCYVLMYPLLLLAMLAPSLMGKVKVAREFVLANAVAFAVGFTAFALIPAFGPWYYYHTKPTPPQAFFQQAFLLVRRPGPYVDQLQTPGLICFPSFHVIWAILAAAALWGFRPIRIPVAVLTGMIILSTMTTGWHYFSDVLGGIIVASLSIAVAKVYAT